ncbi:MAG TPA: phosphate ABC transporter permease subunit PstC [Actinomycetota bacterium]
MFRVVAGGAGLVSLSVVGATAFFLLLYALPALNLAGPWHFLVSSAWSPQARAIGVGGLLAGSVLIAGIGLAVGLPIALATAIFVNEYAPPWLRRLTVPLMDLLAALPSLVFGMWGFFSLQPHVVGPARWLGTYLSAIPVFRLTPQAAGRPAALASSVFVAGVVVGVMVVPVIASITRDVLARCPRDQCEAVLALGGTRWGMVRDVLLPFGRTGIVGATLLGFGRAAGETIAIALILAPLGPQLQTHVLEAGGGSVGAFIVTRFGESGAGLARSGLVAAGLALFVSTLLVTVVARSIVARASVRAPR